MWVQFTQNLLYFWRGLRANALSRESSEYLEKVYGIAKCSWNEQKKTSNDWYCYQESGGKFSKRNSSTGYTDDEKFSLPSF